MIYFTSDLHFFHKNAAINESFGRNFSSVEEMNEILIENWNSEVSEKDTIYVVGDFSFGGFDQTLSIFNKLKGNKVLIKGNHDDKRTLKLPWGAVDKQMRIKYNEETFWATHYPTKSWDLSYHGSFHVFGHVHSKGDYWADGLSCDVGVDLWGFKPVSADTLIEWFKQLKTIKEQCGHFMWKGKPFQEIEVIYFEQINKMAKKI
jgi:calcineurin-like phosphoesterase family protein